MEIVEDSREKKRIMIVMEVSFIDFDQKKKAKFLDDLSNLMGRFPEDIIGVEFRRGCVRFEGEAPREEVERIINLWKRKDEASPNLYIDDIEDFKKFIDEYKISRIKDTLTAPHPIIRNSLEENERKAVIFVHGWRGSEDTFGEMPKFICESQENNCFREIYPYPTDWFKGKSLVFISRNLDNWIRYKCKINGYKKLAFVTHSMGGLVVKKFLVNQFFQKQPIDRFVKEVTFIATPHNGAVGAKLLRVVPGINTDQVNELASGSPFLVDLSAQWSAWVEKFVPDSSRFGCIFGTDDEVVDPTNISEKEFDPVYILGAKHVDIVKPKTHNDEVVTTVLRFLEEAGF
jgi:hypothetical protein